MTRRHFIGLVWLTIAAVLVAIGVAVFSGDDDPVETGPLLPGLDARIDSVTQVEIVGPGEAARVTLQRGDDGWVVMEKDGHPAQWPRVQALLAALATAEAVEPKTRNPQWYSRLGVAPIDEAGAAGVLVRWSGEGVEGALIVGDRPERRDGWYVRVPDDDQAWRVDTAFDVSSEPVDWLRREVIDIDAARVREVEVLAPDRGRVLVARESRESVDFELINVPDGRVARSSFSLNRLGGALDDLQAADVRPATEFDWAGATRLRVQRFDGLEAITDMVEADGASWIRLRVSDHPDDAGATTPEVNEAAQAMAARVDGWAYRLPAGRVAPFTTTLDSLLEPTSAE